MRETPLHAIHQELGAAMVEFGGWHMPVQYGPILDEVRCVRNHVGLFDLSHMGRVNITGPDAVQFVDRIATCFCAKIPEGAIRYGLLCDESGNPIDDVLVYRRASEVFVVVNASNTQRDLEWMAAHTEGLEVQIEDQTEAQAMLALQGPKSESALQEFCAAAPLRKSGGHSLSGSAPLR